jgi:hypothetical protein
MIRQLLSDMFCCVLSKFVHRHTTLFHRMESREKSQNSDTGLYQRPCGRGRDSRVAGDLNLACEEKISATMMLPVAAVRRSTAHFRSIAKRLRKSARRTRNSFRIPELKISRLQLSRYSTFISLELSSMNHHPLNTQGPGILLQVLPLMRLYN